MAVEVAYAKEFRKKYVGIPDLSQIVEGCRHICAEIGHRYLAWLLGTLPLQRERTAWTVMHLQRLLRQYGYNEEKKKNNLMDIFMKNVKVVMIRRQSVFVW